MRGHQRKSRQLGPEREMSHFTLAQYTCAIKMTLHAVMGLRVLAKSLRRAPIGLMLLQIKGLKVIGRVAAVCKSEMLVLHGCVYSQEHVADKTTVNMDALIMSTALQTGSRSSCRADSCTLVLYRELTTRVL